jgi:hypothetical protein
MQNTYKKISFTKTVSAKSLSHAGFEPEALQCSMSPLRGTYKT